MRSQSKLRRSGIKQGIAALALVAVLSPFASAQDPVAFFRTNCMNCHTIGGGRLSAPDLKGVTQRQSREWLANFILDPKGVIDSGDAYARDMKDEWGSVMPTVSGINPDLVEGLLDLIEAESLLDESQFKGLQLSDAPFTSADQSLGRSLFIGTTPLENGGASCISCHSIHGLSALGGGQLGNDLTNVYETKGGRTALSAWLYSPAAEAMQPIFNPDAHPLTADEIFALTAYFESTAGERPATVSSRRVSFLLLGLIGAVATIFLIDVIWKQRFHTVRRALVEAFQSRDQS